MTARTIAAALLVPALAGCGRTSERDAGATAPGPLVVGLSAEVDSWNPYVANDATAAAVLDLVYPRLVRETGDPARPFEPWLAESWSAAPDGRGLTFRLRPDARWTDGRPVTCDDVVFTHRVQTSEALAWSGAFIKERIAEVRCDDERSVTFRFHEPYQDQMIDANDDAVVPAVYGDVPLADWAATAWEGRFVGCGPYRPVSVVAGQEAVLERSPDWWGAAETRIERVVLRLYPLEEGALPRLLDGGVDLLLKVPPLQAESVASAPALRLVELPSLAYTFIAWNALAPGAYAEFRRGRGCPDDPACDEDASAFTALRARRPHPVLADASVRRALTLAIDRRDIVDGVWGGHARVGGTPIVSATWAHLPGEQPSFAPDQAAALLEGAGWRDRDADGTRERDGRALELEIIVSADNRVRRDALARVIANLARVGVRVRETALPRAEFVARVRDKDFDGALAGWWAGTRIEPQSLLHTRAAIRRGNNFASWSTPESDRLLDRAAAAATRDEALPLWQQWQRLFEREQPLTVLYEETRLLGASRRLRDFEPSLLNPLLAVWQAALEPPARNGA